MWGIPIESMARDTAEATALVSQLNDTVDRIKDVNQALAEKRISNEQAQQKIISLAGTMMTRLDSMMKLSDTNVQMIPAMGQAISVFNRLIALTWGDPQLSQVRDNAMLVIEKKAMTLPGFGQTVLARNETFNTIAVAKIEAELMKFPWTPKDFFENPQYRNLAVSAHKNYGSLNPEITEGLNQLVKQYHEVNGIKISSSDFKVSTSIYKGSPAFQISEKDQSWKYVKNAAIVHID